MARFYSALLLALCPSFTTAYMFGPGPFVIRGGPYRNRHTQCDKDTQTTGANNDAANRRQQQQQQQNSGPQGQGSPYPFPFPYGYGNPFAEAANGGTFNATAYREFMKEQQEVMNKWYQQQGGSRQQQVPWETMAETFAETLAESMRRYKERASARKGQPSSSAPPPPQSVRPPPASTPPPRPDTRSQTSTNRDTRTTTTPTGSESLRRELMEKDAQLAEMRQANQKWDETNRKLTARVTEAESRTQGLGASIKQLEIENAKLRTRLAEVQNQRGVQQGPATPQLVQELQDLRVREDRGRAVQAELRAKLETSKRARDGLQAEVLKLAQALQAERASSQQRALRDEVTSRDATITELNAELAVVNGQRESDEAHSQQQIKALREELQSREQAVKDILLGMEDMEAKLAGYQTRESELSSRVSELQSSVVDLSDKLVASEERYIGAEQRLYGAQQELAMAEERGYDARQEVARYEQRVVELEGRVAEVVADGEERERSVREEIEDGDDRRRRDVERYVSEVEGYRREMEGLRIELEAKTKALQTLRRAIGEASAALQ